MFVSTKLRRDGKAHCPPKPASGGRHFPTQTWKCSEKQKRRKVVCFTSTANHQSFLTLDHCPQFPLTLVSSIYSSSRWFGLALVIGFPIRHFLSAWRNRYDVALEVLVSDDGNGYPESKSTTLAWNHQTEPQYLHFCSREGVVNSFQNSSRVLIIPSVGVYIEMSSWGYHLRHFERRLTLGVL